MHSSESASTSVSAASTTTTSSSVWEERAKSFGRWLHKLDISLLAFDEWHKTQRHLLWDVQDHVHHHTVLTYTTGSRLAEHSFRRALMSSCIRDWVIEQLPHIPVPPQGTLKHHLAWLNSCVTAAFMRSISAIQSICPQRSVQQELLLFARAMYKKLLHTVYAVQYVSRGTTLPIDVVLLIARTAAESESVLEIMTAMPQQASSACSTAGSKQSNTIDTADSCT